MSYPDNPFVGQTITIGGTTRQCVALDANGKGIWQNITNGGRETRIRRLEGFKTVAEMRAGVSSGDAGYKVQWRGYYAESDGGSNWGVVKTGDSTSLVDDGGSIFVIVNDAVNGVWVEASLDGIADITKFGARNGVESTTAIQNALNTGLPIKRPYGTYITSSELLYSHSNPFVSFGEGVIKNTVSDKILTIDNPVKLSTTLTDNSTGGTSLSLSSVTGIEVGDLIMIVSTKSWDSSRVEYVAGELLTVANVSGLGVSTHEEHKDTYLSGDVINVYRPIGCYAESLTLIGDEAGTVVGGQRGLYLKNLLSPVLIKPTVKHASRSCIEFENCLKPQIDYGYTYSTPLLAGFGYGLAISSSSEGVFVGGQYHGQRHGIAHGGTIPCRENEFHSVYANSNSSLTTASYDEHENVEGCKWFGGTIMGGAGISGRNATYNGVNIYGNVIIYLAPSDYHPDNYRKFINCNLIGVTDSVEVLRIRPIKERNEPLYLNKLVLSGTKVNGALASRALVGCTNEFAGTTCVIDDFILDGVELDYTSASDTSYMLDVNPTYQFTINNFTVLGESNLATSARLARFSGNVRRFISRDCIYYIGSSTATSFVMTGGDLFDLRGGVYEVTGAGSQGTVSTTVAKVNDVTFKGLSNRPFNFSSSGELQEMNNTSPITTTFDLSPVKYYQFKNDGYCLTIAGGVVNVFAD